MSNLPYVYAFIVIILTEIIFLILYSTLNFKKLTALKEKIHNNKIYFLILLLVFILFVSIVSLILSLLELSLILSKLLIAILCGFFLSLIV